MNKQEARKKRHIRIRKKISGNSEMPRLCIFKSLKHIYAQIIDDESKKNITTISTLSKELKSAAKGKKNSETAKLVGKALAKKVSELGYKRLIFDRAGYPYHGKIKILVEAVREAGIKI